MSKKFIFFSFFGFLAGLILVWATWNYNLGVTADSIKYLEVSRNIRQFMGISDAMGKAVIHWPPAYSAFLACASAITGKDSLEAGIYLNSTLIVLLFVLFNFLIMNITTGTLAPLVLNVMLLLMRPLTVFFMFWTEGLLMVLLMGLILIISHWKNSGKRSLLILGGLVSGVMLLTRYASAGFLAGFILYIGFFDELPARNRMANVLIYSGTIILVFLPWFFYAHSTGDQIRVFAWHPFFLRDIKDLYITIKYWLFPKNFGLGNYFIPSVVSVIMMEIIVMVWIFKPNRQQFTGQLSAYKPFMLVMVSMTVSYVVFLFLSNTFYDAQTRLNSRLLSPALIPALLFFAPMLSLVLSLRRLRIFIWILLMIIMPGLSVQAFELWNDHHFNGSGFTARIWKESETLANVKDQYRLGLISNGADLIRFYYPEKYGSVKHLPYRRDPHTLLENALLKDELVGMRNAVMEGSLAIIYFNNIRGRDYTVQKDKLLELFKDCDISQFNDGFIIRNK